MAEKPVREQTILGVFPLGDDRTFLQKVFDSPEWKLCTIWTFDEARTLLRASCPGVVITEARISASHCWKDLLHEIQVMGDPPPLIVADRLADDRLWAEVLNLGGYDLLMKPFDETELRRVVAMAFCFHENQWARMIAQRKPPNSAQGAKAPPPRAHAAAGPDQFASRQSAAAAK